MIRPEAAQTLRHFSQAIAGAVLTLFAIWLSLNSYGIVRMIALGLIAIGAVIVVEGIRRGRFARAATGDGPGVVEFDERRISWLSAHFGGSVDLDLLSKVEIQITAGGKALWVFTQNDGSRLAVPADAKGADGLMDALSALKGLDYALALKALETSQEKRFVLWRAGVSQLDEVSSADLT